MTHVRDGLAPSERNRSASSWLCAAMIIPCESVSRISGSSLPYPGMDFGEILALTRIRGTSRTPQALYRFGQISVSMINAASGLTQRKKLFTAFGNSNGIKQCCTDSPNNVRTRAAPVGVTVVTSSGRPGNRSASARIRGSAACTSPTDTACIQIHPSIRGKPYPNR